MGNWKLEHQHSGTRNRFGTQISLRRKPESEWRKGSLFFLSNESLLRKIEKWEQPWVETECSWLWESVLRWRTKFIGDPALLSNVLEWKQGTTKKLIHTVKSQTETDRNLLLSTFQPAAHIVTRWNFHTGFFFFLSKQNSYNDVTVFRNNITIKNLTLLIFCKATKILLKKK